MTWSRKILFQSKRKVKLFRYLIKRHAMKAYRVVDVNSKHSSVSMETSDPLHPAIALPPVSTE